MKKYIRILLPSIIIIIVAITYSQTNGKLDTIDMTNALKKIETTTAKKEPTKISAPNTKVKISTNFGDITLELFDSKAPITVDNFLNYVEAKQYDSTIFHRVIKNFMIQGGGFDKKLRKKKSKFPPIVNEASLVKKRNLKGTVAMARTNKPNSATNQFFINLDNNSFLDWDKAKDHYGYVVFGKVIKGMDVVDSIGSTKTIRKGRMSDVPKNNIMITKIKIIK